MTLLEALVVVAITALIAALGFPAVRAAGPATHQRSQAAALAADLRRARAAAQHLDRPTRLTADTDGGGWRWDGGELRVDPPLRLAADRPVTFYPDGSASGGTFTLSGGRRPVTITVDRITGHLAIAGR